MQGAGIGRPGYSLQLTAQAQIASDTAVLFCFVFFVYGHQSSQVFKVYMYFIQPRTSVHILVN